MESYAEKYNIEAFAEELGVDLKTISSLYANYFIEMKSETGEMIKLFDEKNWTMLERVVHNIKGVSANLYINDVYEAASVFDALLRDKKTEYSDKYISIIEMLIKEAEITVREFFTGKGVEL